jgi:CHAT domain-containing protein
MCASAAIPSGDYATAYAMSKEALAIVESAAHPDTNQLCATMGSVAGVEGVFGRYEAQLALCRRLIATLEAYSRRDETLLATVRFNLGEVLLTCGDPAQALAEMSRAHDDVLRVLGPDHIEMRGAEGEMGIVHFLLGDFVQARRMLEIGATPLPGEDPDNLAFLEPALYLGLLDLAEGRNEDARARLGRVAAARRRIFGERREQLANVLEPLANVLAIEGRTDSALVLIREAEKLERSVPRMPRASLRLTEAMLTLARADTASAELLLEQLADDGIPWKSWDGGVAVAAQVVLARIAAAHGDSARAFDLALAADRLGVHQVRDAIRFLPQRPALRLAALREGGLDLVLGQLENPDLQTPERLRAAYRQAIDSRGLVLDEMARRRREASRHAVGADAAAWRRFDDARRRLRELRDQPDAARTKLALALQHEVELAEADLVGSGGDPVASAEDTAGVDLDALSAALAPDEALVSYVRTSPDARAAGRPGPPLPDRWYAFVLRPGTTAPRCVPLGGGGSIETAVSTWRDAALGASGGAVQAGRALRQRAWDPLAGALEGARRILVVPDDVLALVNIAALPATGGGYLIERGPRIQVLGSERELLGPARPVIAGGSLFALGGADYDAVAGAEDRVSGYRGPRSSCDAVLPRRFAPLPASRLEVEGLRTLRPRNWSRPVILLGREADEARFKRLAPKARALHLATHGFFIDPNCAGGWAGVERLRLGGGTTDRLLVDNPMTRCGLVLAGANRRSTAGLEQEDGLLSADEIAALDMSNVEFVVLSACNTGVGDIVPGEGVLGLQHAFRIAGAGPVVMSLWPVEDQATRHWMREFYAARMLPGVTTAEATWRASRSVLAQRRRVGLPTPPSTWGAFVAVGAER